MHPTTYRRHYACCYKIVTILAPVILLGGIMEYLPVISLIANIIVLIALLISNYYLRKALKLLGGLRKAL